MQQRKTSKYFKEALTSSYSSALANIEEAIKRYGTKTKTRGERIVKLKCPFNWNYQITGFTIYKRKLWLDYYWQGDHTDGSDSIELAKCKRGYTIPAETEFVNGYTRFKCSDIRISTDDIFEAIKTFANTL